MYLHPPSKFKIYKMTVVSCYKFCIYTHPVNSNLKHNRSSAINKAEVNVLHVHVTNDFQFQQVLNHSHIVLSVKANKFYLFFFFNTFFLKSSVLYQFHWFYYLFIPHTQINLRDLAYYFYQLIYDKFIDYVLILLMSAFFTEIIWLIFLYREVYASFKVE